jgi:hypothetical protein
LITIRLDKYKIIATDSGPSAEGVLFGSGNTYLEAQLMVTHEPEYVVIHMPDILPLDTNCEVGRMESAVNMIFSNLMGESIERVDFSSDGYDIEMGVAFTELVTASSQKTVSIIKKIADAGELAQNIYNPFQWVTKGGKYLQNLFVGNTTFDKVLEAVDNPVKQGIIFVLDQVIKKTGAEFILITTASGEHISINISDFLKTLE